MVRHDLIPDDLRRRAEINGHAPETITAADLMDLVLEPVKWAVPGVLPEGVTILAGKPKMGKSWLALGWCVGVAAGGCVLGKIGVERGGSLYLGLEDNKRRLQRRLKKILGERRAPETFLKSIGSGRGWIRAA
jgi:RecA-family ATPase